MKSPRIFPLALAQLIAVSGPSALCAQEWTPTSAPVADWQAVASSADGGKLVAAAWGGSVYTSTNSGTTWNVTGLSSSSSFGVGSSADGTKLVAASWGGRVYSSTNSGSDWQTTSLPVAPWRSVGSSADGNKLVAVAYDGLSGNLSGLISTSTNSGPTGWRLPPDQSSRSFAQPTGRRW